MTATKIKPEAVPEPLQRFLGPLPMKAVRRETVAKHIDRYVVKTEAGTKAVDYHHGADPESVALKDYEKMERLRKKGKTTVPPPGVRKPVYVGDTRKKGEGVKAFFKRAAREFGLSPLDLFASRRVLRDAGFSKKEYTHDDAKAWAQEFWPLGKEWAQEHNAAYSAGKAAGYVELTERYWFTDPTTKKETLSKDEEFKRKVLAMTAPTAPTTGAGKPRGTKATAARPTGEPVGKDGWGFKLGTRAAKINAVLSSSPLTPAAIEKKSGATSVHSHLAELCRRKLVKKLSDGSFRLRKGVQSP